MGIKNGGSTILSFIQRGLYQKTAKHYGIYIDGELMRYKGMIESNLTAHNAEEAIAVTSFLYLQRIIENIQKFVGTPAHDVYVYMDGKRVNNKCAQVLNFNFDASHIRSLFARQCMDIGYNVKMLQHGESELQMYLERDRTYDLNVFVTNDSDLISICYDHRPSIELTSGTQLPALSYKNLNLKYYDANGNRHANHQKAILDDNLGYADDMYTIKDSCLWINCASKNIQAYGLDFVADIIGYTPNVFRTFVALCGTDFTANLYTNSMISSILTASKADKAFVNELHDFCEISAIIYSFGLRGCGTAKRYVDSSTSTAGIGECLGNFDKTQFAKSIDIYIRYVTTGVMSVEPMPKFNMGAVSKHFIHALTAGDCMGSGKVLAQYCENQGNNALLQNVRQNLGTWNVNLLTPSPQKIRAQKRKATTSIQPINNLKKTLDLMNIIKTEKLYVSDSE